MVVHIILVRSASTALPDTWYAFMLCPRSTSSLKSSSEKTRPETAQLNPRLSPPSRTAAAADPGLDPTPTPTHNPNPQPLPTTHEQPNEHTQNVAVIGVAADSSGVEDKRGRPSIDTTIKEPTLGSTSSTSTSRRGGDGGGSGGGGVGGGGGGGRSRGRWASDAAVEQSGRGGEQLDLVALEPGQNIGPYRLQVRLLKCTVVLRVYVKRTLGELPQC